MKHYRVQMKMSLIVWAVFILLSLLASCTPSKFSGYTDIYYMDFRSYSDQGFLISPYSWEGSYDPVARVNMVMSPDAAYIGSGSTPLPEGTYRIADWMVEELEYNAALDSVYQFCSRLGADALVDFKYEINMIDLAGEAPVVPQIEISGFAIKRK